MRGLKQKLIYLKKFFASDPRVLAAFLFGSQADGTATPRSDIDLAVLFEHDLDFKQEVEFEVAVSLRLGTDDVDVVNLNRAPLRFCAARSSRVARLFCDAVGANHAA